MGEVEEEEIEAAGEGAVVKIEEGGEDKEGEGVAVAEEEEAGREEEKPLGKETARIGMKVKFSFDQ